MAKTLRLAASVLYAPHAMDARTENAEDLGAGEEHTSARFGLLTSAGGSERPPLPLFLRQRETIRQIAHTAQRQLVQMGTLHRQTASLFAKTLADGEEVVQQAARLRPLTRDQRRLLHQEQRILLESLLSVLGALGGTSGSQGTESRCITRDERSHQQSIKQIVETYYQRVDALLYSQEANDGKEGTESVGVSTAQPECQWGGHLRSRGQCGRATESGATTNCDGSAETCGGHATAAAKSRSGCP